MTTFCHLFLLTVCKKAEATNFSHVHVVNQTDLQQCLLSKLNPTTSNQAQNQHKLTLPCPLWFAYQWAFKQQKSRSVQRQISSCVDCIQKYWASWHLRPLVKCFRSLLCHWAHENGLKLHGIAIDKIWKIFRMLCQLKKGFLAFFTDAQIPAYLSVKAHGYFLKAWNWRTAGCWFISHWVWLKPLNLKWAVDALEPWLISLSAWNLCTIPEEMLQGQSRLSIYTAHMVFFFFAITHSPFALA